MDILKRSFAPITKAAWDKIDSSARDSIISMLSARHILKVEGPKGIKYSGIQNGKLEVITDTKDGLKAGIRTVYPLVEVRIPFELSKWTLDNVERGDKNPDLDVLEDAAKKLALFEEDVIYNGNVKAKIPGLIKICVHKIKFGKDGNEILKSISDAKYILFENSSDGPYDLVVSNDFYDKINIIYEGASLIKVINNLIGGKIYRSKVLKGALLLPHMDNDFEFILGSDFSVGYEGDLGENVRLFIMESFTFRVLDENKMVYFS